MHPRRRAEHAAPERVGTAWASGSGRSRIGDGAARHRIPAAYAAGGGIVERPGLHGSRFSTGVLSALPRLLRLLSTVGTRRLSQPVAGRNPALNGLGIVAALAAEARPLGTGSKGVDGAVTLGDGTLLVLSGVGISAAAAGARRLAAAGARALISWGVAGALDPELAPGTLVLPREIISPDNVSFATATDWREHLRSALEAHYAVCTGSLLTCRAPLGSVAAKARAFRETAAVAVDMESSAVAEVAAAQRIPFLAVRAIVDGAADEIPRAALMAATPGTATLRIGRLLAALARAPGELPALIRLAGRYGSARRTLFAVARSGALPPHALHPM